MKAWSSEPILSVCPPESQENLTAPNTAFPNAAFHNGWISMEINGKAPEASSYSVALLPLLLIKARKA